MEIIKYFDLAPEERPYQDFEVLPPLVLPSLLKCLHARHGLRSYRHFRRNYSTVSRSVAYPQKPCLGLDGWASSALAEFADLGRCAEASGLLGAPFNVININLSTTMNLQDSFLSIIVTGGIVRQN